MSSLTQMSSDAESSYERFRVADVSTASTCHNVQTQTLYGLSQIEQSSHSPTSLEEDSTALSKTDQLQQLLDIDIDEHLDDVIGENERTRSLTQGFVDEKLEWLEEKDHVLDKSLLELERAVAILELSSEYLIKALKRAQSNSSSRSNDSASVYFREGVDDQVSEPDSDSPDPAVAAVWQQLAESTTLPDSDDDDEINAELLSWYTAPSNQYPEEKLPQASQHTGLTAQGNLPVGNMACDDMPGLAAASPAPDTVEGTPSLTPLITESTTPNFLTPSSHSRCRGRRSPNLPAPSKPPTQPRLTTVHKTAVASTHQTLATCLLGPKINIVNGTTSEVYVSDVPLQMLFLFCGSAVIEKLLPGYEAPQDKLKFPDVEAERGGITHVIRYMRRCCAQARTHTSSGEMHVPQGALIDGIETVRACRVLGLHPDADRFERLLVDNVLSGRISDEHVDLIWNGYYTRLRETSLGEAVVWFILKEMQSKDSNMVEDLMQLVEREEFKKLKERIREENKIWLWRTESRDDFLDGWTKERRRAERKKARIERWKVKNAEWLEQTRARNREEYNRRLAERELRISTDSRSSLSRHSTSASARSEARDQSIRSLDTKKALPKTPSQDRIQQTESTPQLHISSMQSLEHTRSGGVPQGNDRKPDISSSSLIVSNTSVPLLAWQGPRPVPVPKKKLSLWKRLKAVL
jgi:hypothetical protein